MMPSGNTCKKYTSVAATADEHSQISRKHAVICEMMIELKIEEIRDWGIREGVQRLDEIFEATQYVITGQNV